MSQLLASFLLSVVSYLVFEVLFPMHILYSESLNDQIAVLLMIIFRSSFAVMVSDLVMGVRGRRLWADLLLGFLVYGVPSMILVSWLNLHGLIGPLFAWSYDVLQGFALPSGLGLLLGMSFQALVLDFPRLMLFVAVGSVVGSRI